MAPPLWEQGSKGPIEPSVLNFYKFQRPRSCCCFTSQGRPQTQCHLTPGGLREAGGSTLPKLARPVHCDKNPEVREV